MLLAWNFLGGCIHAWALRHSGLRVGERPQLLSTEAPLGLVECSCWLLSKQVIQERVLRYSYPLYDLAPRVRSRHLCCIIFVRSESLGLYSRGGVLGSTFEEGYQRICGCILNHNSAPALLCIFVPFE